MSRRTYVYTQGGRPLPEPIEVGEDYVDTSGERQPVYTDRYMEGVRATDGTDISSRGKRRAYMKANGLTDYDDFKGVHEKAAKERADYRAGKSEPVRKATREAIARVLYQQQGRKTR